MIGLAWTAQAQAPPSVPDFPGSRPMPVDASELEGPSELRLPPVPPPRHRVGPAGPQVRVLEIRVKGNTVLPPSVLAETTAPFVGRVLDSDDLETLRAGLTGLYIQAGYVNTRVELPDQDLTHGVLQVEVMEGRLEKVVVRGEGHYRARYLEDRLEGMEGEPLNAYVLERRLRALEQERGIRMLRARL
ncbi:MAG: POTRA domain-containing protein, partial [Myxococcota bacterium]